MAKILCNKLNVHVNMYQVFHILLVLSSTKITNVLPFISTSFGRLFFCKGLWNVLNRFKIEFHGVEHIICEEGLVFCDYLPVKVHLQIVKYLYIKKQQTYNNNHMCDVWRTKPIHLRKSILSSILQTVKCLPIKKVLESSNL